MLTAQKKVQLQAKTAQKNVQYYYNYWNTSTEMIRDNEKRGSKASFVYLIPYQIRSKDCPVEAVR